MSALVHEAGTVSGRTTVMLLTAAVHVVLIAGLMATGVIPVPETGPVPMKSWIQVEPDEPRPAPAPDSERRPEWTPRTAAPPLPTPTFDDTPIETITTVPLEGTAGSADPQDVVETIRTTAIAFRTARPTDDFYPAASIRSNESGIVVVNVCVSASGALEPRPQVSNSSGYPRLDGAAIRWVQEGARFTPATRNGEPVADCKPMRVNFTLKGSR